MVDLASHLIEAAVGRIFMYAHKDLEVNRTKYSRLSLLRIFEAVYPDNICDWLVDGVLKLKCVVANQIANGDKIGECTYFEDEIF